MIEFHVPADMKHDNPKRKDLVTDHMENVLVSQVLRSR